MSACQLTYPPCIGRAEVVIETDRFSAHSCVQCGKEFQRKFPPQLFGLNIRPLPPEEPNP